LPLSHRDTKFYNFSVSWCLRGENEIDIFFKPLFTLK
jgi:hypothetical protein